MSVFGYDREGQNMTINQNHDTYLQKKKRNI